MFLKPFRTKSNVQLKSSDRKKLQSRIATKFGCSDVDLTKLFPSKGCVSFLKIITHSEDICGVYAVDKLPMFFETPAGILLPTVYALWHLPQLIPAFTTHPDVLPRLAKGANLMLPGVIRLGKGQRAYGNYRRDEVVCVNLTSNMAAVGIGLLARSSEDLYMCGGVGVCVTMLHVFGDKLWSLEEAQCLQIPSLGTEFKVPSLKDDFPSLSGNVLKQVPLTTPAEKYQPPTEHFPALGGNLSKKPKKISDSTKNIPEDVIESLANVLTENLNIKDDQSSSADEDDSDNDSDEEKSLDESEDDVLKRAFFTTLKLEGKKLTLPLLTSTFYRCHVVPAAVRPIELKKTTYKKLSKFLSEMAKDRYIALQEEQKGVEKISSINLDHPELVEFVAKIPSTDGNVDSANGSNLFVTEMTELYLVTDDTAKFFARYNLANGQGAEKPQLKKLVKDYVCKNKLQDTANSQLIHCNDILFSMCGVAHIEFDRLFAAILSRMKHSFEMRQKNEVKSAKNPMIQMQLATRSGNKKVTLVNNLEAFGIRLAEFEKACKIGVAASTTVTKLANQKGEQLLVQGNQIKFIHKLLTETYKIPSKNIVGMELAKKEKKAKKK